jgi:hypothetical protein
VFRVLGGINNGLFLSSFGGFVAVGILIFFLKWAFSSNNKKLIVTPISAGKKNEYGLLKALPTPGNYIEAEMALLKLKDSNIKATLTQTLQGPSLMVFERDFSVALAVLKS